MRFMTRRLLFNHRISILFALKNGNHSVTSAIPAYLVNNMDSLILGFHIRSNKKPAEAGHGVNSNSSSHGGNVLSLPCDMMYSVAVAIDVGRSNSSIKTSSYAFPSHHPPPYSLAR
ncbi:hypothetical protein MJ717_000478 [Cronobacter sakazakii]|nr:hypothetical protein [Cronobacter sakazakii]EIX1525376.1 hypothetical protein [Cronobacter sakazakii]EIX1533329.1 hypothetical protein [Cronobacter sakazakii]EIX1621208.1 hypothetical protein [Cronobacter sakazakii]EIX1662430.1 hypothetical protein [Cronobacter sakazakii]